MYRSLDWKLYNPIYLPNKQKGEAEKVGEGSMLQPRKAKLKVNLAFLKLRASLGSLIIFVVLLSGLVTLSCFGGIQLNLNCIIGIGPIILPLLGSHQSVIRMSSNYHFVINCAAYETERLFSLFQYTVNVLSAKSTDECLRTKSQDNQQ